MIIEQNSPTSLLFDFLLANGQAEGLSATAREIQAQAMEEAQEIAIARFTEVLDAKLKETTIPEWMGLDLSAVDKAALSMELMVPPGTMTYR